MLVYSDNFESCVKLTHPPFVYLYLPLYLQIAFVFVFVYLSWWIPTIMWVVGCSSLTKTLTPVISQPTDAATWFRTRCKRMQMIELCIKLPTRMYGFKLPRHQGGVWREGGWGGRPRRVGEEAATGWSSRAFCVPKYLCLIYVVHNKLISVYRQTSNTYIHIVS